VRARIVPAASGARWLATGWRLFRLAPLGWISATLAYWLVTSAVSLVPWVGGALAVALVPAFTLGFMTLARAVERGGPFELVLLFDGVRHHARAQAALGLAYLAAFAAVLGVASLADGGELARWVLAGRHPEPEALEASALAGATALALAAYLPVMLAFWFAPPLSAWHSSGAAKSLFFSLAACLLNWRALLAYGVLATLVAAPLVALAVGAPPVFVALVVLWMPVVFASFYASYRDGFGYHSPQ
jgi:hypothetical protein